MNGRRLVALIGKELRRLARHRGAVLMVVLLLAAALLVASAERHAGTPAESAPVQAFWVDYWVDGPWIEHLRRSVPPEWTGRIRFRQEREIPADRRGVLQYARTDAAVQIRNAEPRWMIWFWQPTVDAASLAPFENWFWRESQRFFREQALATATQEQRAAVERLALPPLADDPSRVRQELFRQYREQLTAIMPGSPRFPEIEVAHSALHPVPLARALAAAMVLFAVFFVGVCLLPSLTCEERERGMLLAQVLSPASAVELYVAKLVVYLPLAALLALVIAGLMQFAVALQPLMVAAVFVAATASCSLGTLIAATAGTQRTASMAAMGYALAVALIVFSAQRFGFGWLGGVFVESYISPLIVSLLHELPTAERWRALGLAAALAFGWFLAAGTWIRIRGWRPSLK